uniref:Uncharacterized protein n=1 Tax=Tanacetum cinerariifolium TaxID=118510 RepID=A0A6L2LFM7_TANCI|nr:hypothetical protein [Tanacetum cinerariifolium]
MAFRNFIYIEDDNDLAFLPKEPSLGFDSGGSPKASVFVVYPGSVAAYIKEKKCKTRGGSSRPPVKRKLAFESSSSLVVHAKIYALRMMLLFFPYLMMMKAIEKMRGKANVIKARERSRKEECYQVTFSTLRLKVDSLEEKKARLEVIEASLHREVEELKQDRRDVVSKVVPYVSIELVHSDELGRLVGMLVSFAITYGRCRAYEQVATMKEHFDLSKAKGYRSSYKKEPNQASNDFATATFPWLDEFVADAATLTEALLLKKPPML